MSNRGTPPSRKTHITRIYGRNRDGDRIDGMYADLQRTDSMQSIDHDGHWQGVAKKFRWRDDPSDSGEYSPDGNPNRKIVELKLVDPKNIDPDNPSSFTDPDEWIPVPVTLSIKHVTSKYGQYQGVVEKFFDPKVSLADYRKVEVRRIYHRDTTIDEKADKILSDNPDWKQIVFQADDYDWKTDSETGQIAQPDTSEYVEVEVPTVIKELMYNATASHLYLPAKFQYPQGRVIKLKNQYLIDESFPAKFLEAGEHDLNPPYRLDPHQYLINISFGGIAVQFYDQDFGRDGPP